MDLTCNYKFCNYKCSNAKIYNKHIHHHKQDDGFMKYFAKKIIIKDDQNKINIYCLSFCVLNIVLEKISKKFNINIVNLRNINIQNIKFQESDILIVWEMFDEYYLDNILFLKDKIKKKIWVFYEHPYHYTNYFEWRQYFDFIFSTDLNEINRIKYKWIPAYHFLFQDDFNVHREYNFIIKDKVEKTKFMCTDAISSGISPLREKLIQTLVNTGIDIDIYGINTTLSKCCKSNIKGALGTKKFRRLKNYHQKSLLKTDTFKNYKFVIVPENLFMFGSFGERIIDCLGSLSIHIYFGSFNAKYIFPDLFDDCVIDGFEFKDCNQIVNYIKNMADDEYNKRINNIKKIRNKYYKIFSMNYICDYIANEIISIIDNEYEYENEFKNINDKFRKDVNNNLFEINKNCIFNLNLKFTCNKCKLLFDDRKIFLKHIKYC